MFLIPHLVHQLALMMILTTWATCAFCSKMLHMAQMQNTRGEYIPQDCSFALAPSVLMYAHEERRRRCPV